MSKCRHVGYDISKPCPYCFPPLTPPAQEPQSREAEEMAREAIRPLYEQRDSIFDFGVDCWLAGHAAGKAERCTTPGHLITEGQCLMCAHASKQVEHTSNQLADLQSRLAEREAEIKAMKDWHECENQVFQRTLAQLSEAQAEIEQWVKRYDNEDSERERVKAVLTDRLSEASTLIDQLEGALKHMTRVTYGLEPSMTDEERADRLSTLWRDCLVDAREALRLIADWRAKQ